jgi:hypothetical protein
VFVRLLHGALALSLATEPAAAGEEPASEPSPAPTSTDGATSDEPASEAGSDGSGSVDAPANPEAAEPTEEDAPEPASDEADEPVESEPTDEAEAPSDSAAPEPVVATEAPRPIVGPPPSGRNSDMVSKALLGGGIASLTLTAGLIGTSAWAWTESNRAERASNNLTGDEQASAQDRRDQMRTIGLITTGAAALYGTTGVVLLLLRARDRKPPPRTVLAPSPGGLSLVGRF